VASRYWLVAFAVLQASLIAVHPAHALHFSVDPTNSLFCPANGHYYQQYAIIPDCGCAEGMSWATLEAFAESKLYNGLQGHLLTINTLDEWNCVVGSVPGLDSDRGALGSSGTPDQSGPHATWVVGAEHGDPVVLFGPWASTDPGYVCEGAWPYVMHGCHCRLNLLNSTYSAVCDTGQYGGWPGSNHVTVEFEVSGPTPAQRTTWGSMKTIYR
jgi:hypothetical protein